MMLRQSQKAHQVALIQQYREDLEIYLKKQQPNANLAGRTIQRYRELNGLTRESLAEILGIATKTLEKIETGKHATSLDLLYQISYLFDFSFVIERGELIFGHTEGQTKLLLQEFEKQFERLIRQLKKQPLPSLLECCQSLLSLVDEKFAGDTSMPIFSWGFESKPHSFKELRQLLQQIPPAFPFQIDICLDGYTLFYEFQYEWTMPEKTQTILSQLVEVFASKPQYQSYSPQTQDNLLVDKFLLFLSYQSEWLTQCPIQLLTVNHQSTTPQSIVYY